jgi:hypothetical protein
MLTFGSMFFEQVYRVDESAQRFRLRELAPRMLGTISEIEQHNRPLTRGEAEPEPNSMRIKSPQLCQLC